jgi:ribosomal protein S18 acetylase RimI-like enzyme
MIEDTVQPPDADDRLELVDVLARAFRDNPMNLALHGPRPARRVRANRAGLKALVLDGHPAVESRVIKHGERVVGGWVALPPGLHALPNPTWIRQIGCFWHQGARAMDAWGQVAQALGALRPLVDHWYLAVLGVEPALQGRGFGGRLLAELIALAAERSVPIYLESDRDASVRFYRSRGFVDRDQLRVHGVRCWCLGRRFTDESTDLCDSVRQAGPSRRDPPQSSGPKGP